MLIAPRLNLLFCPGSPFAIEARIACQIQRLGWQRKIGARILHNFHDAQQEILANFIEFIRVARKHITDNLEPQSAAIKTCEANGRR